MIILNKDEVMQKRDIIVSEIRKGALFVHPTDTIYGIGANALDEYSVAKIRKIKNRTDQPFSVIVPSLDWIKKNCHITDKSRDWLNKLPGPFTFIFKLRNPKSVSPPTNPGMKTLGVRYPNHWFAELVAEANVPFVTTSANITGKDFMTSIETLDNEISKQVDFVIYEGEKGGRPSTLVNFAEPKPIIINR